MSAYAIQVLPCPEVWFAEPPALRCIWEHWAQAHEPNSCVLSPAYLRNAGNPHLQVVEETVLALQSDRDPDVSFFATLEPKCRGTADV